MALFLECTQLCARSALRKYLTKPALLEMAGFEVAIIGRR